MKTFLLLPALFLTFCSLAQDFEDVGWYSYGQSLDQSWGYNVDYFRTNIFPDSTVKVEYSDGMGYVWMHGLGQIFDPTSSWFDDGFSLMIDENQPYMVDSVRIWYRYFRPQDGPEDTLRIQFFTQADIDQFYVNPWEGQAQYENRSYARLSYDTTLLRCPNYTLEFEELLNNDHVFQEITSLSYPVELAINPGEVVGMSTTYFPGNPFNVNDTIDNYMEPLPTNPINSFLMYYFYDNDLVFENDIYNHAIIARNYGRYNDDSNGWAGQYWPGIASGGGLYHTDVDFYVSIGTFIEEKEGLLQLQNAFPNPVKDALNIQFELSESSQLNFSLRNTLGQLVVEESWGNVSQGKHRKELDLSHLPAGSYFYVIATDQDRLTGKIVKY